jgi:hypothetical protein
MKGGRFVWRMGRGRHVRKGMARSMEIGMVDDAISEGAAPMGCGAL